MAQILTARAVSSKVDLASVNASLAHSQRGVSPESEECHVLTQDESGDSTDRQFKTKTVSSALRFPEALAMRRTACEYHVH